MKTSNEANPGATTAAGVVIVLSAIASIAAVALDRMASGGLPALAVFAAGANMTEGVVVGILLAQAAWNLTAAAYLFSGARTPQGDSYGQIACST
jgi:hypothetical protein